MHSRRNAGWKCIRPLSAVFITVVYISVCSFSGIANAQSPVDSGPDETKYRELAISVAADLDSPVHPQAVAVIAEQSITSARFDSPIRNAVKQSEAVDQFIESRMLAAVRLLPASTIPQQEQVSLLLDSLVILSRQETPFGRQLQAGQLTDGPRASILSNTIIAQLSAAPDALAQELEDRFEHGEQPSVIYSTLPLANSHGQRLIPYLIQASGSNNRFVKAATFLSLNKSLTNTETASVEVMKKRFRPDSEKIFFLNDVDKNLILSPNEWSKMLVNPVAADLDGDEKITLDEFVDWFAKRKISQLRTLP